MLTRFKHIGGIPRTSSGSTINDPNIVTRLESADPHPPLPTSMAVLREKLADLLFYLMSRARKDINFLVSHPRALEYLEQSTENPKHVILIERYLLELQQRLEIVRERVSQAHELDDQILSCDASVAKFVELLRDSQKYYHWSNRYSRRLESYLAEKVYERKSDILKDIVIVRHNLDLLKIKLDRENQSWLRFMANRPAVDDLWDIFHL